MKKKEYSLSIYCYYINGNSTKHHQTMKLSDIPKWAEAYKFTHPECSAISIKIWFDDEPQD